MWLRSIFLKTLLGYMPVIRRWAFALSGAVLALVVIFAQVDRMVWLPRWLGALASIVGEMLGQSAAMNSEWLYLAVWQLVLPLLLAAFSIHLGSRLLAADEANEEMELLLAYPVSRRRLLLEKFGVLVAATAGLTLLILGTAALGFRAAGSTPIAADRAAALFLMALVFGCLAFALAARSAHYEGVTSGSGRAQSAALLVLAAAVLLALFGDSLPQPLLFLRYLSPFYDYTAGRGFMMLLGGLCAALLGAALMAFEGREIG